MKTVDAQWASFIGDPQARCLHWLIEPDEWKVLDLFFTVEETSAAFFVVDAPFDDEDSHGLRLRDWLVEQYRVVEPELVEAGAEVGWTPPPLRPGDSDVESFVAAAVSLWEHHQPLFEHLVPVLVPQKIGSADGWVRWLDRLLRVEEEPLRYVVVDLEATAKLGPLATKHAATVRSVRADLDLESAYVEISADAGGLDKPHGMFRHAFLLMANAMSAGDMRAAEARADTAKDVARTEQWTHLIFAVDFARGSGYLGAGNVQSAIACYREAETSATKAEDAGESFGTGLRLKARLGQGAACISAEAYGPGAELYESAAPLARETNDPRTELDCLRMAAYCHERAGKLDKAWDRGIEAVAVGEGMDEETRRSSTLAHAGEGLLRVSKTARFAGRQAGVEPKMRSLLGPGWRPS